MTKITDKHPYGIISVDLKELETYKEFGPEMGQPIYFFEIDATDNEPWEVERGELIWIEDEGQWVYKTTSNLLDQREITLLAELLHHVNNGYKKPSTTSPSR